MNKKITAVIFAILAAVFYSVNIPFSKVLLQYVPETFMASFLYFGAAIGIGLVFIFTKNNDTKHEKLTKKDLPYTIGMIVLDIAAPILLMLGLSRSNSSSASLIGNFEIVATSIIALAVFKEYISKRLWFAIALITVSSALLSVDDFSSLHFSAASLFVLGATVCWGFENNCTRKISSKSTYEIVILKGFFSGLSSFIIALIIGEAIPPLKYIALTLLLGSIAYGFSIFLYVRAQNVIGAAKTSAYYAVAPFIGALLSFIILKERISANYLTALVIMIVGTIIVVIDTLLLQHSHLHTHTIVYTHNGTTHTHIITHEHGHSHFIKDGEHSHNHNAGELESELLKQHE